MPGLAGLINCLQDRCGLGSESNAGYLFADEARIRYQGIPHTTPLSPPSNVYNQPLGEIWAIQRLHHFPVWLRLAAWPSFLWLRLYFPPPLTRPRVYYHVSWLHWQTMRRARVRGIQTTLHSHQGRQCQLSVYHKTAPTLGPHIKMSTAWLNLFDVG